MYCCDNVKVVSVSKFLEIPPVIILQIQPITQVFMLPDIIHVGDHRYVYTCLFKTLFFKVYL